MHNNLSVLRKAALAALLVFGITGCASMDASYQMDADIMRMQHLKCMGAQIEKYHEKTGRYPLQGEFDAPAIVQIGTQRQLDASPYRASYRYYDVPPGKLHEELGEVLDDVCMPVDPQSFPTGVKPCLYVYMLTEDNYFFTVYLYHEYPFTKPVSKHTHFLQIGSKDYYNNTWMYEDLIKDAAFVNAISAPRWGGLPLVP